MTMTLRLTDEQDRALTALAEAEGVSKREAAVRAITDRAARLAQEADVRALAREAMVDYRSLLLRLSQ